MLSRRGFSSPTHGPKSPMRGKGWRARNKWQSQAHFQQSVQACSPLTNHKEPQPDQPIPDLPNLEDIAASSEHANTHRAELGMGSDISAATVVQTTGQEQIIQGEITSQNQQLTQSTTQSTTGATISCNKLSEPEASATMRRRVLETSKVKAACKQHYDEVNDRKETVEGLSR